MQVNRWGIAEGKEYAQFQQSLLTFAKQVKRFLFCFLRKRQSQLKISNNSFYLLLMTLSVVDILGLGAALLLAELLLTDILNLF